MHSCTLLWFSVERDLVLRSGDAPSEPVLIEVGLTSEDFRLCDAPDACNSGIMPPYEQVLSGASFDCAAYRMPGQAYGAAIPALGR